MVVEIVEEERSAEEICTQNYKGELVEQLLCIHKIGRAHV